MLSEEPDGKDEPDSPSRSSRRSASADVLFSSTIASGITKAIAPVMGSYDPFSIRTFDEARGFLRLALIPEARRTA